MRPAAIRPAPWCCLQSQSRRDSGQLPEFFRNPHRSVPIGRILIKLQSLCARRCVSGSLAGMQICHLWFMCPSTQRRDITLRAPPQQAVYLYAACALSVIVDSHKLGCTMSCTITRLPGWHCPVPDAIFWLCTLRRGGEVAVHHPDGRAQEGHQACCPPGGPLPFLAYLHICQPIPGAAILVLPFLPSADDLLSCAICTTLSYSIASCAEYKPSRVPLYKWGHAKPMVGIADVGSNRALSPLAQNCCNS